ncbi:hypothetical protein O181_005383, partial [Austropuccinia psidii MF-1]|nr:hypothetical protein [Austropuccinia psidii MF-1]
MGFQRAKNNEGGQIGPYGLELLRSALDHKKGTSQRLKGRSKLSYCSPILRTLRGITEKWPQNLDRIQVFICISEALESFAPITTEMSPKLTKLTLSSPSVLLPSVLCGYAILSWLGSPWSMASSGYFDPSQTYYVNVQGVHFPKSGCICGVRRMVLFGESSQFLMPVLLM